MTGESEKEKHIESIRESERKSKDESVKVKERKKQRGRKHWGVVKERKG